MYTELNDLKNYLTNKTGYNTYIGVDTISDDNYIRIIPASFSFQTMNSNVVGTNFPVDIEVTVNRDDTIKGFEILEKVVKYINQSDYKSGGRLLDEGETEYTDNSFILRVVFNLKTIIQN